jgi:hypothetical protein
MRYERAAEDLFSGVFARVGFLIHHRDSKCGVAFEASSRARCVWGAQNSILAAQGRQVVAVEFAAGFARI